MQSRIAEAILSLVPIPFFERNCTPCSFFHFYAKKHQEIKNALLHGAHMRCYVIQIRLCIDEYLYRTMPAAIAHKLMTCACLNGPIMSESVRRDSTRKRSSE